MGFTIGPDRGMYFSAVVEPSNRLGLARYGATVVLVTNVSPVSVSGGATRPPDSLYMYRYSTGRNPCRYGCWSMVNSIEPALMELSVVGVRSKPPAGTLPDMPAPASAWARNSVEPASTAKAPLTELLCASR